MTNMTVQNTERMVEEFLIGINKLEDNPICALEAQSILSNNNDMLVLTRVLLAKIDELHSPDPSKINIKESMILAMVAIYSNYESHQVPDLFKGILDGSLKNAYKNTKLGFALDHFYNAYVLFEDFEKRNPYISSNI